MSTETNHAPTVRTYRGRTLEELIPKIRAELGPDAIILREREGRTGGVNGFFAQRCVEVDAQAAPAVDIYDEDVAAMPNAEPPGAVADDPGSAPGADPGADPAAVSEPASGSDAVTTGASEPAASGVSALAAAGDPVPAGGAGSTPLGGPAQAGGAGSTPPGGPAQAGGAGSTPPGGPAQAGGAGSTPPGGPAQAGGPAPAPVSDSARVAASPVARPAADEPSFAQRLEQARREREAPAPAARPAAPEPPAASATGPDPAAAAVARELTGHGISEAWAHELIASAAAHLRPFVPDGELRDAVRAGLAAGITAAPMLPSSGAAVAFVGAGGAGKTRCSAAMANAYARASTLPVTIVSLAGGSQGNDIAALLGGSGVPVQVAHGPAAAEMIAEGRERGLVVVDTTATSPVDERGVTLLAAQLADFELDAVYLTVPATLSAAAGRGLLHGLTPLGPTAMVITHADETDELGIVTELAHLSGLPIAYIHDGLQLDGPLAIADPARVAARVLP